MAFAEPWDSATGGLPPLHPPPGRAGRAIVQLLQPLVAAQPATDADGDISMSVWDGSGQGAASSSSTVASSSPAQPVVSSSAAAAAVVPTSDFCSNYVRVRWWDFTGGKNLDANEKLEDEDIRLEVERLESAWKLLHANRIPNQLPVDSQVAEETLETTTDAETGEEHRRQAHRDRREIFRKDALKIIEQRPKTFRPRWLVDLFAERGTYLPIPLDAKTHGYGEKHGILPPEALIIWGPASRIFQRGDQTSGHKLLKRAVNRIAQDLGCGSRQRAVGTMPPKLARHKMNKEAAAAAKAPRAANSSKAIRKVKPHCDKTAALSRKRKATMIDMDSEAEAADSESGSDLPDSALPAAATAAAAAAAKPIGNEKSNGRKRMKGAAAAATTSAGPGEPMRVTARPFGPGLAASPAAARRQQPRRAAALRSAAVQKELQSTTDDEEEEEEVPEDEDSE
jgi:hypothetical protein